MKETLANHIVTNLKYKNALKTQKWKAKPFNQKMEKRHEKIFLKRSMVYGVESQWDFTIHLSES